MDAAADATPPTSPRWCAPIEASHIATPDWVADFSADAAHVSPLTGAPQWSQAPDAPPQSPLAGAGGGVDVGQWVAASAAVATGPLAPPATPDGRDARHMVAGPLTGHGGAPSVGSSAARGSSSGGAVSLADSLPGPEPGQPADGVKGLAGGYVVVVRALRADTAHCARARERFPRRLRASLCPLSNAPHLRLS